MSFILKKAFAALNLKNCRNFNIKSLLTIRSLSTNIKDNLKTESATIKPKTPEGKLDASDERVDDQNVEDPYASFPEQKNPKTGEIGGPRGPEPTRYGDWERKGLAVDF